MSEVMESLAVDEKILNALRNAGALSSAALLKQAGRSARSGAGEGLVQSRTQWCSSLGERDLQCLLQVIEGRVIPQLLKSYSPARHAPLARFESPG